jgi:ABC-type iron transport system FetAB ATPase subunit
MSSIIEVSAKADERKLALDVVRDIARRRRVDEHPVADARCAAGGMAADARPLPSKARSRDRPGSSTQLVGPSGCGSSSLMKLVTGPAPARHIEVAGKEVNGPLKIVGMAFRIHAAALAHDDSRTSCLPLEIEPHRHQFRRARATRRRTRCSTWWGWRISARSIHGKLSGGMQQRASLCRRSFTSRPC